jgi:hypothetical protein
MNANKSCTATFTLQQFTLTLTTAGTGTGNVTGAGTYNDQATATVTATPAAGSTFAGWSGPNGAECTTGSVLMNANKSCIATFTLQQFTLTLTKAGTGTGNVTGAGTYNDQTNVAVSATPNAGSTFAGWSGPNGAECTTGSVLMNANKSCVATFSLKRTLTVSTAGNGTVTSSPAGINCGGDCVEDYTVGTVVTLTPTPDSGWQFDNWSGAGDCTDGSVTMTVALTCTANFSLIPIVVPNVVNLSQSAAQSALTTAGLTVGTVTTVPSETVGAGNVISHMPGAGVSVAPGSSVDLVVSSGPPVFLMGVQNDGQLMNSLYRIRTNGVVTKIADLNHRTHGLAFVGGTLYSIEELTLSQSGTPPKLYTLNPDTGATLASIPLSLSTGEGVEGGRGLVTDPGSNQLWALLIVPSEANTFRRLVTINLNTGLATQIAKIPGNFMDMAFDAAGTLYVITDNRPAPGVSSVNPARIYTVNKTTGATTEFLDVSAGAVAGQPNFRESETIGAGFSSDLLYHLSGQHKVTNCCTKNILFESIHRTTKVRTPISITGPDFFVTTALTLVPSNSAQALNDLDANGTADLVWRNTNDGTTAIWLMNGTTVASSGFPGGVPLAWQIAGVGDVNGDGKADVIWRNGTNGTVAVWIMNGLTVTAVGFPGSASTDFQIAGIGDVNGDGKADLVWRNTNDGTTAIWLMNGTALASSGFPGGVPLTWQIAGAGDVNGDGKADVIWRNTSGTVAVWIMNGLTVTAVGFPGSASTVFEIAGIGDVNGDGKADLVWRDTSSGVVAVWLMNSTVIASSGFPAGVPLSWKISRVGDVNGDGKSDVVWRNISGVVAVWLMNGLTINSVGFPGSASIEWEIQ